MLRKLRSKKPLKWLQSVRKKSSSLLPEGSCEGLSASSDESLLRRSQCHPAAKLREVNADSSSEWGGVQSIKRRSRAILSRKWRTFGEGKGDEARDGKEAAWALRYAQCFAERARRLAWSDAFAADPNSMRPAQKGLIGEELSELFTEKGIPHGRRSLEEVWQELGEHLLPHVVPTQNPGFMGHMTADIPEECYGADILISYLNQNMVKRETSALASDVETEVLRWFHQLIYRQPESYYRSLRQNSHGTWAMMVSGGTMANLSALTVARNRALCGAERLGVAEALRRSGYEKAVVLTSERSHYSVAKACALIGLGQDQLVRVAVDPYDHKIHVPTLRSTILDLQSRNVLIVAVAASASSTETGSIDDLEAIAELCRARKIWFHVDGAWGGAYLFSPKLSVLLKGVQQADSVVIDGHKMLGLTMGGGMVFFRDSSASQSLQQNSHYVLRRDSADLGCYHLEGSRPFYALKLWLLCQRRGREGLQEMVEASHEKARLFQKMLRISTHFVITTPLETNIITYQWCPPALYKLLCHLPAQSTLRALLEEMLSGVCHHLHSLGWQGDLPGFVSKTQISIQRQERLVPEALVLRAIPVGRETTAWHIKDLLEEQHRHGFAIFKEAFEQKAADSSFCALVEAFKADPVWQDFEKWLMCSESSQRSMK